jgi:hypothetical protein
MDESTIKRHLIENEATFRKLNKRMQKSLKTSNNSVSAVHHTRTDHDETTPMYFFCECSDENCQMPVKISPKSYNAIHEDDAKFILIPGHETKKIEDVVEKHEDYYVVKKYIMPPKNPDHLKSTSL